GTGTAALRTDQREVAVNVIKHREPKPMATRNTKEHKKEGMVFPLCASVCFLSLFCSGSSAVAAEPEVVVGSKTFTESVILGGLTAQLARGAGAQVRHRAELGGTPVLWNALLQGAIDVYPEYTGTIVQEILAGQGVQGEDALRQALAKRGIRMS